jgi:hypothetical protein
MYGPPRIVPHAVGESLQVCNPVVSRDGRTLFGVGCLPDDPTNPARCAMVRVEVADGTAMEVSHHEKQGLTCCAWSPAGKRVANLWYDTKTKNQSHLETRDLDGANATFSAIRTPKEDANELVIVGWFPKEPYSPAFELLLSQNDDADSIPAETRRVVALFGHLPWRRPQKFRDLGRARGSRPHRSGRCDVTSTTVCRTCVGPTRARIAADTCDSAAHDCALPKVRIVYIIRMLLPPEGVRGTSSRSATSMGPNQG